MLVKLFTLFLGFSRDKITGVVLAMYEYLKKRHDKDSSVRRQSFSETSVEIDEPRVNISKFENIYKAREQKDQRLSDRKFEILFELLRNFEKKLTGLEHRLVNEIERKPDRMGGRIGS